MISLAPVVLAAGESSRMGFPKALARFGDETALARLLHTLDSAGFDPVKAVVVTRASLAERLKREAPRSRIVINPSPAVGMRSSLAIGLGSLGADADGAMIFLVDHPRVRASTVVSLADAARDASVVVVRTAYAGRRGHPYVIARSLFDAVDRAPSALTMRDLLREVPARDLEVDDPAVIEDLDTPESLEAAGGRAPEAEVRP